MPYLKKLLFAPFFLLFLYLTYFELNKLYVTPNLLFSFSLDILIAIVSICGLFFLTSLFFNFLAVLNNDWRLTLGTIIASAGVCLLVFKPKDAAIIAALNGLWFLFDYWSVQNNLKQSFDFHPTKLIGGPIRSLATLLVITASILYFLGMTDTLKASDGFQVPDSLIDSAIKLSGQESSSQDLNQVLPPDQLSELKQLGISPDSLKQVSTTQLTNTETEIKKQVKDQIQKFIAPYQPFIPIILGILFFFTLSSFVTLFSILTRPLTWFTFYILEQAGFIKFEKVMKEAKKMQI